MKSLRPLCLLAFSVISLSACSLFTSTGTPQTGSGSMVSENDSPATVTRNVSYVGTVEEQSSAGSRGYSLKISNGTSVTIESTDSNLVLASYLGKRVEVRGSVQPSADGSMLMRVEELTVLDLASPSSSSETEAVRCGGFAGLRCPAGYSCTDDLSDDCDPSAGGSDCMGVCVPTTAFSAVTSSSSLTMSSAVASSKAASLTAPAPSSSATSIASSTGGPAGLQAMIQLMAKQNYATPSLWTQQYCTSHVAFCIPVHKNWYFKSFGATTTNLWHTEFSMAEINAINEGPIVLNLVSGSSAAAGVESGGIKTQGSDIVGYKDWKGDHFEIIADASLRAAVSTMLSSITSYTPGE